MARGEPRWSWQDAGKHGWNTWSAAAPRCPEFWLSVPVLLGWVSVMLVRWASCPQAPWAPCRAGSWGFRHSEAPVSAVPGPSPQARTYQGPCFHAPAELGKRPLCSPVLPKGSCALSSGGCWNLRALEPSCWSLQVGPGSTGLGPTEWPILERVQMGRTERMTLGAI